MKSKNPYTQLICTLIMFKTIHLHIMADFSLFVLSLLTLIRDSALSHV